MEWVRKCYLVVQIQELSHFIRAQESAGASEKSSILPAPWNRVNSEKAGNMHVLVQHEVSKEVSQGLRLFVIGTSMALSSEEPLICLS